MDPKKLIRDPVKVHSYLKELPDGRLVTTKGVKIYIPSRFAERGLASVGIETYIVGIYAIVVDDLYYGVSMVNAMMRIEPSATMTIVIDDEEFFEFVFDPGSTVVSSLELVKQDTLTYMIYDEIIAKGHVPWYLEYTDLGNLFNTANKHAGANIGSNHEVTELIVSIIARDSSNRHLYYRNTVKSNEDIKKKPPAFIALRSVTYAASNTLNKIAGSYMHEGLVSALVTPTERVEKIESLLRR
jgi:hypothetical protein